MARADVICYGRPCPACQGSGRKGELPAQFDPDCPKCHGEGRTECGATVATVQYFPATRYSPADYDGDIPDECPECGTDSDLFELERI